MKLVSCVLIVANFSKNIKSKRTITEKCEVINDFLSEVDEVYKFLEMAKTVHDQFENFASVTMHSGFVEEIKMESTEILKIDKLKRLLKYKEVYLTNLDVSKMHSLLGEANDFDSGDSIKSNIKMILEIYPILSKSVEKFKGAFVEVEKILNDNPIREKVLHGCLAIIVDQALKILQIADKLILNIAPILGFFHAKFKEGVKDLR
jgi:hypothetical protein